jgi:hypothetical protein
MQINVNHGYGTQTNQNNFEIFENIRIKGINVPKEMCAPNRERIGTVRLALRNA